MPNTIYGPYSPSAWTDGVTALNQTRMNNLETQASDALHGFNGDLLTPFVLSGVTCARNGVTLNQLDVTSGSAYVKFADSTVGLISVVASTAGQFTTSTPSTTYYLFLLNTGLWQWGTTSTGPTNSLAICQATTDGSGNILVVTDKRVTSTTLFPTMAGQLAINPGLAVYYTNVGGSNYAAVYKPLNATAAQTEGHTFQTWNGTAISNAFAVGSANPGVAGMFVSDSGVVGMVGGQATAGPFGVPVIVGSLKDQIAGSAAVFNYTLVASVPATGLYRVTAQFYLAAGVTRKILLSLSFTQGHSGNATSRAFVSEFSSGGLLWDGTAGGDGASAGDALGAVMVVYLQAGTVLTLRFQDANWTSGNNLVGGVCERLF